MFLGQLSMSSPFLSTLSLRRATSPCAFRSSKSFYFYPRSPCGERHDTYAKVLRVNISIHALLAESDVTVLGIQHRVGISIHALLAESDPIGVYVFIMQGNFYPRSPCGERQQTAYFFYVRKSISIHALLAESDQVSAGAVAHGEGISIHALLAESDRPGPR